MRPVSRPRRHRKDDPSEPAPSASFGLCVGLGQIVLILATWFAAQGTFG